VFGFCRDGLPQKTKIMEWLKFGGFGEFIKFAKLSSANLL